MTTFSPLLGSSSLNSAASDVPGVKRGAPSGVLCTMCTKGADAARYFSRRDEIFARVESTRAVFSSPSAYLSVGQWVLFWDMLETQSTHSFWASMMSSTLSLVEAVDGWAPTSSRKLLVMIGISSVGLFYCCFRRLARCWVKGGDEVTFYRGNVIM